MTATAIFTPSASTSVAPTIVGLTFSLPAVDAGNTDLALTNAGLDPIWVSFAANAPVGPTVPGCLVIPAQAAVLLTSNSTTIAAMAANPLVLSGPQAAIAAAATALSAVSTRQGAVLTVSRGSASAHSVWRV